MLGKYYEGIWHTGISVFEEEFYYGSGISHDLPGKTPFGVPTKTLVLGTTELKKEKFLDLLKSSREEWSSEKYNMFEHNCNQFTNFASQ